LRCHDLPPAPFPLEKIVNFELSRNWYTNLEARYIAPSLVAEQMMDFANEIINEDLLNLCLGQLESLANGD
jgi:hypothetical protein